MREHVNMVKEFHEKHGFPVGIDVGDDPSTDMVRVHLIAEEGVAELALAIAERDKVKVADALGDLAYVLFGAAVTYGIPLQEVFEEIHRSNMTKSVRRPGDTRLRDKGPSYEPADVAGVLSEVDRKLFGYRHRYNIVDFSYLSMWETPDDVLLYVTRLREMAGRSEEVNGRRCLELYEVKEVDGDLTSKYSYGVYVSGSYGAVGSNSAQAARVAMGSLKWVRDDGEKGTRYPFEGGRPFPVDSINRYGVFLNFNVSQREPTSC